MAAEKGQSRAKEYGSSTNARCELRPTWELCRERPKPAVESETAGGPGRSSANSRDVTSTKPREKHACVRG